MSNQSTIELLREMKFSAMASEFVAQLEDSAAYRDLDFEERFSFWSMPNGTAGATTSSAGS